ncbi:MAG: hypothetical protein RLZZ306_2881 [Bacteroidota bacterium]|jgi:hypothetical protein
MEHKLYGFHGSMLPSNPTIVEEAMQNADITNFWMNVPSPPSTHGITIDHSDLVKLYNKNTLEIVVKKLQNRANITFKVSYKTTIFPDNSVQVNIAQKIQQEGNNAVFRFRIDSQTIFQISQHFTKNLRVTLSLHNGVISLLILQTELPLQPTATYSPQPLLNAGRTNPSGGVKIP